MLQCPRCQNSDAKQLYMLNGQYYCRKCIPFKRVYVNERRKTSSALYNVNI
ncbi:MAG: hypothetical protein LUF02_01290 [Erysipelotrichaceae bacterium]|nr:hypothetical protein [Erysipelotrichaceae bacterium]